MQVCLPAGNHLPHGLVRVDRGPQLIDVGDLHRLADLDGPGVRLLLSEDHLQQRRLTDPVRADDTDDAGRRKAEAEPVDQLALLEPFDQPVRLDHEAAQPGTGRNLDLLEVQLLPGRGLVGQLLILA